MKRMKIQNKTAAAIMAFIIISAILLLPVSRIDLMAAAQEIHNSVTLESTIGDSILFGEHVYCVDDTENMLYRTLEDSVEVIISNRLVLGIYQVDDNLYASTLDSNYNPSTSLIAYLDQGIDKMIFDEQTSSSPLYPLAVLSNELPIYNYVTGTMGLNVAAACGVLANLYAESGFDPNAVGDNGTSYGICQWHDTSTGVGRWTNLKNYCNSNGYNWQTLNGQLRFLQYELSGAEAWTGTLSYLKSIANTANGAYDAGYYWCYYFERPANVGIVSDSRGVSAKNTYWPKYGGSISPTNNTLTVNFDLKDGSFTDSGSGTRIYEKNSSGMAAFTLPSATKSGYTFNGWTIYDSSWNTLDTGKTGNYSITTSSGVNSVIYAIAQWASGSTPPPNPAPTRYMGIDVSRHQGSIDWQKVKNAGVQFVIMRCQYGGNGVDEGQDSMYKTYADECERLEIPYGFYTFARARNAADAVIEAQCTLESIEGYNPAFPIYYDMEYSDSSATEARMPATASGLGAVAKAFCDTVQAAGYKVGVYANGNWWKNKLTDPVFQNDSWHKWVAAWGYDFDYAKTSVGREEFMWQYNVGSEGYINGISTRIDLDYWYGPFPTYSPPVNGTLHGYYLYPATQSAHTATYSARPNTLTYPSQPWITNPVINGHSVTYILLENANEDARDGSIRLEDGSIVTETHHILQCSPKKIYAAVIQQAGGSVTITLPNGYQYSEYGEFSYKNAESWVNITSAQSRDARATVTVSATSASEARSCTVQIWMKGEDNPNVECHIADIEIRQDGILPLLGDCNDDKKIDAADVTYLKRAIAGRNEFTKNNAMDVNRDGKIDAADVTYLKRAIAKRPGFEL